MSLSNTKSLLAKLLASENLTVEHGNYPTASMDVIDNSPISDEFKDHLRKEFHKIYDDIGQMISMVSPTGIPSCVKLT